MKKLLVLLLIIMMAFAAGCVLDSGSSSKDDGGDSGGNGSGTSGSASTYLPLTVGATWSFTETTTSYWGETPDVYTSTFTTTCIGTTTLSGSTYWTYEVESEWGYTSTFYLRIDGNNVYLHDPDWVFKAAPTNKKATENLSAMKKAVEDDEILLLVFNKSAGYTWEISSDTGSYGGDTYSSTETGKFYGLESVTTAAGTFANSARFDFTSTDSGSHVGESYSYVTKTSIWLAPGVGIVKDLEDFIEDGATVEIFDTVLTSYDLSGSGGNGGGGEEELYTITGQITDSSGDGIEGVYVGATAEIEGEDVYGGVYTGSDGYFVQEHCADGTWTIEPYSLSHDFDPESRQVIVSGVHVAGVDFTEVDDGGGNGGGGTSTSWQPLTDDSEWRWSEVSHNADGDLLWSDEFKIVADFAVSKNGVDYQLMDNYDEWDDPYYRFVGDILTIWWDDDAYIWFKPAGPVEAEVDDGQAFPYYNFGATVGDEWSVFTYEDDYEDMTVTCIGEYMGTEYVTVEAGSFSDCAKMKLTYTKLHTYTDVWTGDEVSDVIVLVSYHWFAQGVGEIMIEETRTINGEIEEITEKEVIEYTVN